MALFSLKHRGLYFMLQKNNENNANEENQKVFLIIKMIDCKNEKTKIFFEKLINAFEEYETDAGLDDSPPINYFLEKSSESLVKIYHGYNNITYKNGILHAIQYMTIIKALDKNNANKLEMYVKKYNKKLTLQDFMGRTLFAVQQMNTEQKSKVTEPDCKVTCFN